jgi:DUF2939 family protein
MKKTIATIVIIFAVWLAWSAWPFFALYDLVRAAQAADVKEIEQRVDLPELRRSLSGQIIQAYARVTGKPVGNGLMIGVASAFADPFVEKMLSAQTLADMLKTGWPHDMLAERPEGFEGLDINMLGSVFQLYFASDYGIGEFRVPLPLHQPVAKQFRIRLALSDWTWKLSGLDLPHALQDRLARELIRQEQAKPPLRSSSG